MILVSGATGFLGYHLVTHLRAHGYPLRALVRPQSDVTHLRRLGVELAVVEDISDAAGVEAAVAACRYVIHAAAIFRMWGALVDFWQTNVEGTATLLRAAAQADVERFVHISSIAVVGRTSSERVIDETHPCRPQDAYQRTKLEAEWLARAYHQWTDLDVMVLRLGALYGPRGQYAFNRLFFEDPLRGLRIRVARGRHLTFPVYAEDVAVAVEAALERGRPGAVYNICGDPMSHNAVNDVVSEVAGISRWRLDVPAPAVLALARVWTWLAHYTGREPFYPWNLAHYVFQDWPVSSAKARAELGFKPTPFAEGARKTVAWYRERA